MTEENDRYTAVLKTDASGYTVTSGDEVAVFTGPNALDRAIHFAGSDYYDRWADPEALAGY